MDRSGQMGTRHAIGCISVARPAVERNPLDPCFLKSHGCFPVKPFKPLSLVEQVTAHLRAAIASGELAGRMPGIRTLAGTLGVSANTVVSALARLEHEGFLEQQGDGRRSLILLPDDFQGPAYRVTLLLYDREDRQVGYVSAIQEHLKNAGHLVEVADKTLVELDMKVKNIANIVQQSNCDAWVILSATQEILEWFIRHEIPAFSIFGRFRGLPLAGSGPEKVAAFRAAVRRLAELGHRRIALLQPEHMRRPTIGLLLRETLEELESHGIETGPYNLPDWEQTPAGLRHCLDSLFATSPPTALILDRPDEYLAAQQHLARQGVITPRDVSLVCTDDDPAFEWCLPSVSCVCWDWQPLVRRVLRWVSHVSKGKEDRRQIFTPAKFIERGSIGPAPVRRS
jgi:DNA-binding LacI/PurR family transcriptional regulator